MAVEWSVGPPGLAGIGDLATNSLTTPVEYELTFSIRAMDNSSPRGRRVLRRAAKIGKCLELTVVSRVGGMARGAVQLDAVFWSELFVQDAAI